MASVFLSYARADEPKARAIAALLERHGHSVWWDRFIRGGSEFSKEIEKELKAADVIAVLWSANSVESAWVRDEAAAGRDSGRLVPITIDGIRPPLGFRQFQAIDLSARRIDRRRQQALLGAIAGIIHPVDASGGGTARFSPDHRSISGKRALQLVAALALAVMVLTALFWQPWRADSRVPTVAVAAAEPGAAAESLASDLLIKLGVLQSTQADALQLVDIDSPRAPDFVIKVGGMNAKAGAQANLMLVDDRADALLWSDEFSAPSGNLADLRQQMAYSAAQVLECAVQAEETTKIRPPTLKLYLSGCANMSNLLAEDPRLAISVFERVVEQEPNFRGGWKKLLLGQLQTLRYGFGMDAAVRRKLHQTVTRARRVDPAMGELFLAEAWLASPRPIVDFMKLINRAVAADPDSPDILAFQAMALTNVGRMEDALAATRRAVRANPLSPFARDALITALLNSDQVGAARNELQISEKLWPGATSILQSRFAIEFRFGNPRAALRIMQSGQLGTGFVTNPAHESYLQAKIDPTAKNKEIAIENARALYDRDPTASWVYARALAEFARHEDLIDLLLRSDPRVPYTTTWVIFRSSFRSLHNDPDFMRIVHRFGLTDFWQATGKWPDFCARPDLPYDCKAEAAKLK